MGVFWLVTQVEETHPVGERKLVNYGGMYQCWERVITRRKSHNPRKGIGSHLWIEADTATEAWQYLHKIKAPGFPRRWRRPRHVLDRPENIYLYIHKHQRIMSHGPTYIHFSDGVFIRIDGLHKSLIDDIVDIGLEHDW